MTVKPQIRQLLRQQSAKNKSSELISTLAELENAIHDWENASSVIKPEKDTLTKNPPQIAQTLLKKLRQQIDELDK